MARNRIVHRCRECGATTAQWLGRCPDCGEWGTLEQDVAAPAPAASALAGDRPMRLVDVDPRGASRRATGLAELDRVLDGGFVSGSVTLLGGEPGMGKSTLLLQALASMCERGATALLVTAEESKEQVRLRADRLGAAPPGLSVVAETSLPVVLAHVEELQPDVLAVDSIQTVVDPDVPGVAGSVGQVRDSAARLVRLAKERDVVTLLVGHVTKDGALAGPRVLEHVVDTVLAFEGDRHHALRMLHALKHRFGSTDELGLFEMTERGLLGVADPSALFLADRRVEASGSVVAPVLEGARPLLVEVQALVAPTGAPMPRRTAQGLDSSRLSLLLAVLQQRAYLDDLSKHDVWASVAGGVRVAETAVDLAAALAVASAYVGLAVPAEMVAVGEVGLGGEIRQVGQTGRRLAEASRLGFRRAVVPASVPPAPGIETLPVRDLVEALRVSGVDPATAYGIGADAAGPRAVAAPTR